MNTTIKNILKSLITTTASLILVVNAYASDDFKGYKVRQEKVENNGVLVSRPVALDVTILNIIKTNQITNIEEYAQWVEKNFTYKSDEVNNWQSPENLLKSKVGDCEDFTLLNMAVLQVMGYKSHFIAVSHQTKNGHAICVFEKNGEYYYFDNAVLKKTNAHSIHEFIKSYIQDTTYSLAQEYQMDAKKWNTLYVKV